MSQIPRPILVVVVAALGVSAVFGVFSGYMASAGRHGFDKESATAVAVPANQVADAKPLDPSAIAEPPAPTPEELAAEKAAADKKKAEDQAKAGEAALPKVPQLYVPPPVNPSDQATPGSIEGPPPPTPEQSGPNLY